jgi:hypothetical protein
MATFSGKDGKILIGSTTLAEITGWTLTTSSNNPAYASSATAGHKTRRGGVKDFTGSIQAKIDPADPLTNDFDEGSMVTLLLYLNATDFFTCPSIIDSLEWNVDINDGDVVGVTAQFSATAAPTKPSGF